MIDEYKISILEYLLKNENLNTIIKIPNLNDVTESVHITSITELTNTGYIKNTVAGFKITSNGKSFLTRHSVGEIKIPQTFNIDIGHKIQGSVYNSRLDLNNNLPTKPIINHKAIVKSKPHWLEVIYWIAGISSVLIALYEFYLKYHLN